MQVDLAMLAEVIEDADRSFLQDELAYLALSGKIERAIQDRLAFALHRRVGDGQSVSREWQRKDIAIVNQAKNLPTVLLELKAMHSFDFTPAERPAGARYLESMWNDACKAYELNPLADTYLLALMTHPWSVPDYRPDVVKYLNQIRAMYGGGWNYDMDGEFHSGALNALLNGLKPLSDDIDWPLLDGGHVARGKRLWQGELRRGTAFGADVTVFYVLAGPLQHDDGPLYGVVPKGARVYNV